MADSERHRLCNVLPGCRGVVWRFVLLLCAVMAASESLQSDNAADLRSHSRRRLNRRDFEQADTICNRSRGGEDSDGQRFLEKLCWNCTTGKIEPKCRTLIAHKFGAMIAHALLSCSERSRLARLDPSRVAIVNGLDQTQLETILTIFHNIRGARSPGRFYSFFSGPHAQTDLTAWLKRRNRQNAQDSVLFVDAVSEAEWQRANTKLVRTFVRRGGSLATRHLSLHLATALARKSFVSTSAGYLLDVGPYEGVNMTLTRAERRRNTSHPSYGKVKCVGTEGMFDVWRWAAQRKSLHVRWRVPNDTLIVHRPEKDEKVSYRSLLRIAKPHRHRVTDENGTFPRLELLLCYDKKNGSVFHITGDVRQKSRDFPTRPMSRRARPHFKTFLHSPQTRGHVKRLWRNFVRNSRGAPSSLMTQPLWRIRKWANYLRLTDTEIFSAAVKAEMVLKILLRSWKHHHEDQQNSSQCESNRTE